MNLLKNFWVHVVARLDGMIHPDAAADVFLAPLHRSFLISSIVSGAVALIVMPLHLALAGPPHAAAILVLAWLLVQWPLALYLSRSGALDRVIGVSSALFACFVAAICLMTGGSTSFALLWLLIPPVEAAFSTNRKTAFAITLLCASLLTVLSFAPAPSGQFGPLPSSVRFLATLAALLYAGMLALRISMDRKMAQSAVRTSNDRRQLMSQSVSEIFCELGPDGSFTVMGGPAKQILGHIPTSTGDDWLFSRLHVADRPLYLTKLSDVRGGGEPVQIDVRLRVGAASPGEAGQSRYRHLTLGLRAIAQEGASEKPESRKLLLTLRASEDPAEQRQAPAGANPWESRTGRISQALLQTAGQEACAAFSEILSRASDLQELDRAPAGAALRGEVRDISSAGEAGLSALQAALELLPEDPGLSEPDYSVIDVRACLERCCKQIAPAADRFGVAVELNCNDELPRAVADGKLLHQAFSFVLSDMIGTSGHGATLVLEAGCGNDDLELVFSIKNRRSSLCWSAEASRPVLEYAHSLLERTGANLSLQTVLGHGESVTVRVPAYAASGLSDEPCEPVTGLHLLAKTA